MTQAQAVGTPVSGLPWLALQEVRDALDIPAFDFPERSTGRAFPLGRDKGGDALDGFLWGFGQSGQLFGNSIRERRVPDGHSLRRRNRQQLPGVQGTEPRMGGKGEWGARI
jgi:hypothetical protein